MYLYRAVDWDGNTIDFFLSKTRDAKSAKRFLKKTSNSMNPRLFQHNIITIMLHLDRTVKYKFYLKMKRTIFHIRFEHIMLIKTERKKLFINSLVSLLLEF